MPSPLLRRALIRNSARVAQLSTSATSSTRVKVAALRAARNNATPSPLRKDVLIGSSRSLFGWAKKKAATPTITATHSENHSTHDHKLFYPFSKSPHADLRAKAERMAHLASCPVCSDTYSERRHVQYECPDCGWPTHCSEYHWSEDKEHAKYCSRLREANEDEHDMRSGRPMDEFELPGIQESDEAVSFANWDVFWYTRGFKSADTERVRRHLTKFLTYPVTIASVLHEFSGLTLRNQRVTPEGYRSLAAIRSSLHTPQNVELTAREKADKKPIRIFLLGSRSESNMPLHAWFQISHLFPSCYFEIYHIGPQVSLPSDAKFPPRQDDTEMSEEDTKRQARLVEPQPIAPLNSSVRRYTDLLDKFGVPSYSTSASHNVRVFGLRAMYHEVHAQFAPFDPYNDVFFTFSPGFGFPSSTSPPLTQLASPTEWGPDMPMILDTKCMLIATGFSPKDVERDVRALDGVEGVAGEYDWVITPGVNPFGSEKWEIGEFDPRVMVKTNWGIWGIRGKRRDVRESEEKIEEEEDPDDFEGRYVKDQ